MTNNILYEKALFALHPIPTELPAQTNFLPLVPKTAFTTKNATAEVESSMLATPIILKDISSSTFIQNISSDVTTQEIFEERLTHAKQSTQAWAMPPPLETIKSEHSFPTPLPYPNATLAIRPLYGQHRRNSSEVIFSFARGLGLTKLLPFVKTLWATGYTGDLVIGISNQPDRELKTFLKFQTRKYIGLVVYEIPLECINVKLRTHCRTIGMFESSDGKQKLADQRNYREMAQLRFEYYWAWATLYSPEKSKIWLFDARDVFFQRHPFEDKDISGCAQTSLHVFEESPRFKIREQRSNRRWIKGGYGDAWYQHLASDNVICSGTTFGGQIAIEWYTRAMVHQFDRTNCTIYGCDQGHHNVLVRGHLLEGSNKVASIHIHPQGSSVVDTLGLALENTTLRSLGLLLDNETIVNFKGRISPIVHQYDRDEEFRGIMLERSQGWLQKLRNKTQT
eukprot:CAMPEP_0194213292 /NCGR_PEP_ID=MMETSP0156-20130528/13721_1 /TAXON_ID=33649 /ORGANISM="Thalassionema nitzschioides, Strain L26-B" /LENGTH=451 /DNA_ID=CAMNT_0038941285 /DNA_START=203 /DNA_END=1558 /DNA_ORIENTATION=-